MNQRERENERIAQRLSEFGLRATRNNIIKWRLFEEINNEDKRLNAICIYCGQPISLDEAIKGNEVDVEHIIPKSRLFDDSQSNKTLAHRRCNANKGDLTAFDFMKSKSEKEFTDYIERVNNLYINHIIKKSKRDKLLMTEARIPDDFIDRQLRESQYISKKAREILQTVCRNVWCTSGKITAELRHLWGWDDVVMELQLPKYKSLGFTETKEWESDNGRRKHVKEVIKDWTKRDDHRHHSIDALTIACTKQSYIQRFNTLNSGKTREDMYRIVEERSESYRGKLSLLEKYIISQRPISVTNVKESASKILISFKSGKKVTVTGSRKVGKTGNKRIVQQGIIIPRGALSEESVYGKIKAVDILKPVRYLFENPQLIFKPYIKALVEERIASFNGDIRKALASVKKDPIYLDKDKTRILEYGTCFREKFVIKYPIDINFNKIDKVIDKKIKQILEDRLKKFEGKPKLAFRDVQKDEQTVLKWYEDEGLTRPIRSVRCFTGLSAVVNIRKDSDGRETGYVKPGNNHHIAIYSDLDGNTSDHVCTFWHAVERKKFGIPVIIRNTNEVWDKIQAGPENKYIDSFLNLLPFPNLSLIMSIQQNEMFILGLSTEEVQMAVNTKDYCLISEKLYRVQKLSIKPSSGQVDIFFRHHLETQIIDDNESRISKRYINVQSIGALLTLNPFKVKISNIGEIMI
jgi:CRISPR-associated endonuclease Csn1